MSAPRAVPAPKVTEAEWQETVVATMHALGWKHLHVRRSIGKGRHWVTATNVVGWPDLFAWHEGQRRTIAVELKAEDGQLSDHQDAVLASLSAAGVDCYVWRPSDYPEAVRVLRGTT